MSKEFNTKSFLPIYFGIALIIFVTLAIMRLFYSVNLLVDTYEHIHASWLVGEGMVPYRDFFEHHNPLLWYLFAPITWIFDRDSQIVYVARGLALCGYFFVLYFVYCLSNKYSGSSCGGLLAILFLLCFTWLWSDISNLRPDIFMYISILAATNCFFEFLDTKKTKFLSYSYFLWCVAFLFLQKASIYGLGFVIANLYLLYKKEILLKDISLALIAPLFIFILFFSTLYLTNIGDIYFSCNFTFNMLLKQHFGLYASGLHHLPEQALILSFIIIRFFSFSSKGVILFFMWLLGGISFLHFAPHAQYYFFFFVLSAILLSPYLVILYNRYNLLYLITTTMFLSFSFFNLSFFNGNMKQELALIDYVLKNTEASDKLLNGNYSYNLFNFDTDYHWFGFFTTTILADLYTDKTINYDQQIKKYRPKLLFISDKNFDRLAWQNTRWLQDRNQALLQKAAKGDRTALSKLTMINTDYWQIDMDFVKQNYRLVDRYGSTELWQRIDNESLAE